MKELSIEEKARRYDEAIERAQEAVDDGMISQNFVDDIFPELAESEDERMKKKFLELMKCPESYAASGITTEEAIEMIAWLEKVHLQHE